MISVVIPVYNENENIAALLAELKEAAKDSPISEIIYVDDGSDDTTPSVLTALRAQYPQLRVLRHTHRSGQSAALSAGVRAAGNEIIVTMDGDGQNCPSDIASLYNMFQAQGGDQAKIMVAGQRKKRNDNAVRRYSSRIANNVRSAVLKDNTRDTGCSLKMFRKRDYLNLPYFNHMHRYLPALMMRDGVKVLHQDVGHRARARGVSKYGTFDRLWVGIVDLVGVKWLLARARVLTEVHEEY